MSTAAQVHSALGRWRDRFGSGGTRRDAIDYCPWPGPRPLTGLDDTLLVGRRDDTMKFLAEVTGHKLIVLSGASGVGKSSLLQAGLIPELRRNGYHVAVCSEYSGDTSNTPGFVAGKIHGQFAELDLPEGNKMFSALHKALGKFGVIVFDQFEELIRYAPTQKEHIFKFLVQLNHRFETKVIISLRNEYLHELRTVEKEIRSFSLSQYMLEEIDSGEALAVVQAAGADVIEDEAAQLVAQWWLVAQQHTSREDILDPYGRIGLLHLQAFLYVLHDHHPAGLIGASEVEQLTSGLAGDGGLAVPNHRGRPLEAATVSAVFKAALRRSVSVKLARCRQAALTTGFDGHLIQGASDVVSRSVTHLSSAGYKLIREAADLADNAMGADLDNLLDGTQRQRDPDQNPAWADPAWREHEPTPRLGDGQFEAMLRVLLRLIDPTAIDDPTTPDLVRSGQAELAALADQGDGVVETTWSRHLHRGAPPWVADPNDVTCGVMSGMAPAAVLIEELRRFVLALVWMRESSLVRITTPTPSQTMVSLIHDGFGPALNEWAKGWDAGPDAALHAVTAPRGASYLWELEGIDVTGEDRPRVIANVRWRGGYVRSRFADVVFVNCDLRGTLFERCTFEGVTFVNCLMDGAIFSDCRFAGPFAPFEADWDESARQAPVFVVDADARYVDVMAQYRGLERTSVDALYSPLPGAPAAPAEPGVSGSARLHLAEGGATIYGGRVSALVVRRCDFRSGGLAMRLTTGSGLELVEMTSGQIDIWGSAIRQLTISSPLSGTGEPVAITANGCFLGQVWVGRGLQGSFAVTDSKLAQVWNESDVDVSATDSAVFGLLGVRVDNCVNLPEDAKTPADLDVDDTLRTTTQQMDYRRNPAREFAAMRRLRRSEGDS